MASYHRLYEQEIYTGETEPPGAKIWVPLSKDGKLLKSNVNKMSKERPVKVWVYNNIVLQHLCSPPYEWVSTTLMYAEGIGPASGGRWKDERSFRPGIDDV
jgi:hypothetical protein